MLSKKMDNNKDLNTSYMSLTEFDCIGLDLDHTLCKYKLDKLITLLYEKSSTILVEEKGYDKSLLQPMEIHNDLCIKGLVLDIPRGDFLKLSESGFILRASHGTRALSDAEIRERYGEARRWEHFGQLLVSLEQNDTFRYVDNYYDMAFIVLFSRLIDLEEAKPGGWKSGYKRVQMDMMYAYRNGFIGSADGKAFILETMVKNVPDYLEECTQEVKAWLRGLRKHCKIVFLLSSAYPQYAIPTMNYTLGEDWSDYFDICLLNARKPGFFNTIEPAERPFFTNVNDQIGEKVMELQHGGLYLQGNITTFNNYLMKVTGLEQPKVLYFGDSLRSDVFPTRNHCQWQGVLVLEELEVEACIPSSRTAETMDGTGDLQTRKNQPSQLRKDYLSSNQWGSFFGECCSSVEINASPSSPVVNTLWTYFTKTYACMAIPDIDYMAGFPSDYKFETFSSEDWRRGYHPGMPQVYNQNKSVDV